MAQVVRMSLNDSERPIDLLKQHHPGEFVGDGHFSQRQSVVRLSAAFFREAVGGTNGKDNRQGIAVLMITYELGKLFR